MRLLIALLVITLCADFYVMAAPEQIGVEMQILNADTIDLAAAYWTVDVLFFFTNMSTGQHIYYPARLKNMGRSVRVENMTMPAMRYYGTLFFMPDASGFPFDSQNLEITIEDPYRGADQIEFIWVKDGISIDPKMRLRGWNWDANVANAITAVNGTTATYPALDVQFSSISAHWRVSRAYVISIQMLIPPSLMLVSVFVSYSIPITQSVTRLGIVQSALVSETLLHTGLVRTTATGTIMTFDYFMILCYVVIILSVIENVVVMVLLRGDKRRQALGQMLEARAKLLIWLFAPGLFTLLFLPVWAAIMIIIIPSILYFLIRLGIRKLCEYRQSKKSNSHSEDEDSSSDEENVTRLANNAVEMQTDFRKAVIKKELDKNAQKKKPDMPPPGQWDDTETESS